MLTVTKRTKNALFLLIAPLFLLAIALQVDAGVWVSAEGVAALEAESDLGRVRDEAIRDAWRRASEQGVGLFLHAEARVEDLMLVSSAILTRLDAFIVNYEVVREWEDNVFYRVEIFAEVDTFQVGRTLEDLGYEIESIGNPRTAVRIREHRLGEPQPLSVAEALVRQTLEDKGFMLVKPNEAAGCPLAALDSADSQAALELAQAFDADVAVVGKVTTEPRGSIERGSFTWYSATALVDLLAVLRSTGEVLGSVYIAAVAPRTSMEAASVAAIEDAVSNALPKLIFDVIANLSLIDGTGLRAIRLVVEGIESFEQAQYLRAALSTLREASSVQLRQYGKTMTVYDVTYLGPADALGVELESDAFSRTLHAYSGQRITLSITALDFASIHAQLGP